MAERGKSVQRRLWEFQGQLRKMLPLVEGLLQTGEVQEPEGTYTASQEEHAARPAESRYRIDPYGRRNHTLYDGEDLVAVMAYKRGAVEVKRRFEMLEEEIATGTGRVTSKTTWPKFRPSLPPGLVDWVTISF